MPERRSYWVEFFGDRSAKIEENQSILNASLAAGIPHYHACGGNGECSTCRILVIKGEEYLSGINNKELALRQKIPMPENTRLACQTFVSGSPVIVQRIIRDEMDIQIYVENKDEIISPRIGEEKELVLFFSDIRNFTPFMETRPPFDVIHIMRRLFHLFCLSVENNKGEIIETSGDGFYAIFGLKNNLEEAVNNALKAGFLILNELELFNQQYAEKYFMHHFEVGMGIHWGKVILGNISYRNKKAVTVMGLPVNIASRLQLATRRLNNNFIISDETLRLCSPPPIVYRTTKIGLKGIKNKCTVHLIGNKFLY